MEKVLIVDDEDSILETLSILYSRSGYQVETASSGEMGIEKVDTSCPDLVVCDIKMPRKDGISVLRSIRKKHPLLPVIIMTAQASLDTAMKACNEGAFHYLQKPFKNDDLINISSRALAYRKMLKAELYTSSDEIEVEGDEEIIGRSESFLSVMDLARKVAKSDSTVLIQGESGTGKEVIAKFIHRHSSRSDGPFLSINCGALPETLLESELFGHVKGSFTGAIKDKEGLFCAARRGTFFLDEIGETSPAIQIKLLRVLQEREMIPVGATESKKVDVRIISATNKVLEKEISSGRFRSDLFYRLNVIQIEIPPLRQRKEDVPLLVEHFLNGLAKRGGTKKNLSDEALKLMCDYDWPGNVRELENVLERAYILQHGEIIKPSDLTERFTENQPSSFLFEEKLDNPTMEMVEKAYIKWVVDRCEGNKSQAAEILGIDPSTLYRKLNRYGLANSLQ